VLKYFFHNFELLDETWFCLVTAFPTIASTGVGRLFLFLGSHHRHLGLDVLVVYNNQGYGNDGPKGHAANRPRYCSPLFPISYRAGPCLQGWVLKDGEP